MRLLLAIAVLMTGQAAWADLIGQSGAVEFDYPCLGCLLPANGGPVSFTVPVTQTIIDLNSGFGIPAAVQNLIDGSGIDVTFLTNGTFNTAAFNGEVFTFPTFAISGLHVVQNLGTAVSFDTHHIYLNLEGTTFSVGIPSSSVRSFVDVAVRGSAVPEPSSDLLFDSAILALGLAGVLRRGVINKRRSKQNDLTTTATPEYP